MIQENRSRSRMHSRYGSRFDEDHSKGFGFFFKLTMIIMLLVALTLGYRINEVKQFVKIPEAIRLSVKNLTAWFPFESWFNLKDTSVSAANYQKLADNYYVNGSTTCSSILNGVVLSINDDEKNILVQHDNGVLATYGNLESIDVIAGERVNQGAALGSFNESVKMDFLYNGAAIDYLQAMAIQ